MSGNDYKRRQWAGSGVHTLAPPVAMDEPDGWTDRYAQTATHYVVLRTVRLSPPALPTPQGAPASVSVLSPTSQIGVTVVLANQGSSDERRVSVRFSLVDPGVAWLKLGSLVEGAQIASTEL